MMDWKKVVIALVTLGQVSYGACILGGAFCADDQGQSVGGILQDGNGSGMVNMTSAQMNAATPRVKGQEIYCSNCTRSFVCVSTGTAIASYAVAVETGTMTSPTHCQ